MQPDDIFCRPQARVEAVAPAPPPLTLLLLLPAVVTQIGDIIVLHIPLHGLEVGARVLAGECVGHVVADSQVVRDAFVDVAHRPGRTQDRHRVGFGTWGLRGSQLEGLLRSKLLQAWPLAVYPPLIWGWRREKPHSGKPE